MAISSNSQQVVGKPSIPKRFGKSDIVTRDGQDSRSTRKSHCSQPCWHSHLVFLSKVSLRLFLGFLLAAFWLISDGYPFKLENVIDRLCKGLWNISKSILSEVVSADTVSTYCIIVNNSVGKVCRRTSSTLAMIFDYIDQVIRQTTQ